MAEILYRVVISRTERRQKTTKDYYNVRNANGEVESKYIDAPAGVMENATVELANVLVKDLDVFKALETIMMESDNA